MKVKITDINYNFAANYQPLNSKLTAWSAGDTPSAFTLGIVDSADAAAWRSALGVITLASGTYTPALTNISNIDTSTAFSCQYLRVGNVVTVSGYVNVDPTSTGVVTILGISLPIASNFTTASQCAGAGASYGSITQNGAILADTVNDRAELRFLAVDSANRSTAFTFTYTVL